MEAVNLLPAYARPRHPWAAVGQDLSPRRVLEAGSVVACVAVLGLGLGYIHERSVVNHKAAALSDVQAQVAVADAKAAPYRSAQTAAAARMTAATTASEKRVAWEQLLADVSRVLPNQVYLQSLSVQSPTPLAPGATAVAPTTPPVGTTTTAATGVSGFSATGVASSHVNVALVLDRLASLPWLTNVTLLSTANGSASGTTLSRGDTFSVSAGFNPNGGAK
jgi:Tfp pilus assembly protein PilN